MSLEEEVIEAEDEQIQTTASSYQETTPPPMIVLTISQVYTNLTYAQSWK